MKKIIYSLLFFTLITTAKSNACSCGYNGSFLSLSKTTSLTAIIKVTKYLSFRDIYEKKTPMSMEVEIIEVLRGNETRKTVTVWGDKGNLCRPYLSQFKEGEYYAIAFYPGQYGGTHAEEKTTDYSISICGTFWLAANMKTATVTGDVDGDKEVWVEWSLKKLRSAFRKP